MEKNISGASLIPYDIKTIQWSVSCLILTSCLEVADLFELSNTKIPRATSFDDNDVNYYYYY